MRLKRFVITTAFVAFLFIAIGTISVRKTQESELDWFSDRDSSSTTEEVFIGLPRLPENTSREIFETTPSSVSRDSKESTSTPDTLTNNSSPKKILYTVPFTSQAPTGKWFDARFQDGCEEASVLMAMRWIKLSAGDLTAKRLTAQEAEKEILAISDYEQRAFGNFHDTSVEDTIGRIMKGYFEYSNVEARHDISTKDIQHELETGNLVIVPMDGQLLDNPYYTPPGPDHHMLLIIGYDPASDEFITNDPGTRRGEGFRYSSSVLGSAIRDYPTGDHEPVTEDRTAMIVVRSNK